jgi:hypothetical protein
MGRRKKPADLQTIPRRRASIEAARERYHAAGLVQINVWVPQEDRDTLLEWCRKLRHTHLRRIGYGSDDSEGNTLVTRDGPKWE